MSVSKMVPLWILVMAACLQFSTAQLQGLDAATLAALQAQITAQQAAMAQQAAANQQAATSAAQAAAANTAATSAAQQAALQAANLQSNAAQTTAQLASEAAQNAANIAAQQQAALDAATFAAAQEAARQAANAAATQEASVLAMRQLRERQAAETAAANAAGARAAALQAIMNAQNAIKQAGDATTSAANVFMGQFPGTCRGDGMYYMDQTSYYLCNGAQKHLQNCRSGYRAGPLNTYVVGNRYTADHYCNVPYQGAAGVAAPHGVAGFLPNGAHAKLAQAHDIHKAPHGSSTVTTQTHSHKLGGHVHTVQKHVRTTNLGKGQNGHLNDHSIHEHTPSYKRAPEYHYHFYYGDKATRGRYGKPRLPFPDRPRRYGLPGPGDNYGPERGPFGYHKPEQPQRDYRRPPQHPQPYENVFPDTPPYHGLLHPRKYVFDRIYEDFFH